MFVRKKVNPSGIVSVRIIDKSTGSYKIIKTIGSSLVKLYKTQKEKVQDISYSHSRKVLGGQISIVFYDVTTLYFLNRR